MQINEANFKSEVLESRLPVLVDFWAEWCGPCKMLGHVLEQIAAEHAGRAKVVAVNVDENPSLAELYRVQAIPTLLYFANGRLHDQTVGAASKKAIVSKLEEIAVAV